MSAEALTIEGEFYEAKYANGLWAVAIKSNGHDRSVHFTRAIAEYALALRDEVARQFVKAERDRILGLIEWHMEDPKEPEGWATLNYLTTKLRKETETND